MVSYSLWNTPRSSTHRYVKEYKGLGIWWVKNKLKEDDSGREANYEMNTKI